MAIDIAAVRQAIWEMQSPVRALQGVLVIDCHGHIGPHSRYYVPNDDVDSMVRLMDSVGIDRLCTDSLTAVEGDYKRGNDMTAAAVAKHSERLIGRGCINPNYPDDMEAECRRCFEQLGMKVMKLHCSWHGKKVDDPAYRPAIEYAAAHSIPILAHLRSQAEQSKAYAELAQQFSTTAFIIAHATEPNALDSVVENCVGVENVYFDLTGYPMCFRSVERLVSGVGGDRVLYGSDIAWLNLPYELGAVLFADISDEDREKILGLNMARLLA
jgi:predicted TIM-barrel fold metal-dependent hydrolase